MEGMDASDTPELHIRGDFRRAEFVFPLLKMVGKVTCIILLLYICVCMCTGYTVFGGGIAFQETHAARRLTSATRVKTDVLI